MLANSQIRARAREVLGGKIFGDAWLAAVLIVFISTAMTSAASTIPFGSMIILGPVSVGVVGVWLRVTRTGEKAAVNQMFDGFKDFGGNLVLGLMISLFIALWTLLFIIPGIVKGLSYSMAFHIKCDHPEYTWKQCIEESKKITYGHKKQLFCLLLSFIGWILLGTLCLGIGVLWVSPYIAISTAIFYEQIKGDESVAECVAEAAASEETITL